MSRPRTHPAARRPPRTRKEARRLHRIQRGCAHEDVEWNEQNVHVHGPYCGCEGQGRWNEHGIINAVIVLAGRCVFCRAQIVRNTGQHPFRTEQSELSRALEEELAGVAD